MPDLSALAKRVLERLGGRVDDEGDIDFGVAVLGRRWMEVATFERIVSATASLVSATAYGDALPETATESEKAEWAHRTNERYTDLLSRVEALETLHPELTIK